MLELPQWVRAEPIRQMGFGVYWSKMWQPFGWFFHDFPRPRPYSI